MIPTHKYYKMNNPLKKQYFLNVEIRDLKTRSTFYIFTNSPWNIFTYFFY